MLRSAIFLLISYVSVAPITSLISFDMTQTAWANVLTYIWILGALPIWFFIAMIAALAVHVWSAK